jgi:hypothetical protein
LSPRKNPKRKFLGHAPAAWARQADYFHSTQKSPKGYEFKHHQKQARAGVRKRASRSRTFDTWVTVDTRSKAGSHPKFLRTTADKPEYAAKVAALQVWHDKKSTWTGTVKVYRQGEDRARIYTVSATKTSVKITPSRQETPHATGYWSSVPDWPLRNGVR